MTTKHYCDNPACGVEVMAGSTFCHVCGTALGAPVGAAQGQVAASQGAALQNPVAAPLPASNPGTGAAPFSPGWRQQSQQQNGFVDPALYSAQQPNQPLQPQTLTFNKRVNWQYWLVFWLLMLVLATGVMLVLDALITTRFYNLVNTAALTGAILFVLGCFVTIVINNRNKGA